MDETSVDKVQVSISLRVRGHGDDDNVDRTGGYCRTEIFICISVCFRHGFATDHDDRYQRRRDFNCDAPRRLAVAIAKQQADDRTMPL